MARSGQKKGQRRVRDATSEILPVGANCPKRAADGMQESLQVTALAIGQALLGQLPNPLIRIELRRIGREALQVEALRASAECTNQQATMGIAAVPENKDVATEVSEQLAQEVPSLHLPNIVGVELEVEVQPLAGRRHRNPRDGRHAVAPIAVMDRRRLADGRPGGGDGRCQLESRLVDKDEVGTQPLGVFFTIGQSRRRNRRISAWLRSNAFFCGFWWLQPSACRSLPT